MQQAITKDNVGPDFCRHMVSSVHNGLIAWSHGNSWLIYIYHRGKQLTLRVIQCTANVMAEQHGQWGSPQMVCHNNKQTWLPSHLTNLCWSSGHHHTGCLTIANWLLLVQIIFTHVDDSFHISFLSLFLCTYIVLSPPHDIGWLTTGVSDFQMFDNDNVVKHLSSCSNLNVAVWISVRSIG